MNFKKRLTVFASSLLSILTVLGLTVSVSANRNNELDATTNAICQGAANDENNNIEETTSQGNIVDMYRTLLKYDVTLGDDANSKNVVPITGEGVLLNGVPFTEIPNAVINYAHGKTYMQIKIPKQYQVDLLKKGDAILEIIEGTAFQSKTLDYSKFILSSGKWKKVTDVTFTGIQWNDIGYKYYEGKNGVLLDFSANLSTKQAEIDGGIQSTDFSSTTGEHIYLGGKKLSTLPGAFVSYHSTNKLFIYATNMSSYRTLKIESGASFLDVLLPEVELSYNVSTKWSASQKSFTSVTFTSIKWNDTGYNYYEDKKGVLLEFSGNLSKIQSEIDGGIQPTDFSPSIGDSIYLGGHKLSTLPGAFISYHSTNLLFIYADNMVSYRHLKIEAGTLLLDASLPEVNLYYINPTTKWSTSTKTYSNVSYSSIIWNEIGYNQYAGKKGLLLNFSANLSTLQTEIDGGIRLIDYLPTIGDYIYLGGHKLSTLPGAFVGYYSTSMLFIYADNMSSYRELKICQGAPILDVSLPEVNLYYLDTTTKWSVNTKTYTDVSFTSIQWNEIGYNYYASKNGVLLNFSANLSKIQSEIDGGIQSIDFTPTAGEHIYLGGKKLSTLPGAFVSYHSQNKLFIYADNMSSYRSLKIENKTPILDVTLAELTLYYGKESKWSLTKEQPTEVNFSTILWNNIGYDAYEGKNGVLLSYSDNLSNANNEIKGGIKLVNYADTTIGEHIKLDGTPVKNISGSEVMYFGSSFLWIYVPDMDTYSSLIVENSEFLTVILPETRFAFDGTHWNEVFAVTSIVNGEQRVDYCIKDSGVTLGVDFYKNLFSDEELDLKLVKFIVNNVTYYPGDTLEINDDTTVYVTAAKFDTSMGAAIRISDESDIRFETKINKSDYDYLINIYSASNVEVGTYIVSKDALGVSSYEEYFNNAKHVEGVDYFKIVNKKFVNESSATSDGYYKYYGSMKGVTMKKYCTDYCGVSYIKVNDGNKIITLYGEDDDSFSRSIYEVCKLAYEDYTVGTSEKAKLTDYLDGIVSIKTSLSGIEIENNVTGYDSPYTLVYDTTKDEYTVTGDARINTVLFNEEEVKDAGNIMKMGGTTYKVTNYNLSVIDNHSTLKFKLSPIAEASSLVDFTLNLPTDRDFKILQITDTQIIDSSQMRTPSRLGPEAVKLWSRANIDKNCFNHISMLVEQEQPDLIIFTGDIVYGEFDDSGEIWQLMIEYMDSLNIPWAPVFGNHDNETKKGVQWQCEQLENAKNCLFKKGTLTGNGNYSIGLVNSNGKIERVIYMMDTQGCLAKAGLAADQLTWMKSTAASIDSLYGEKTSAFACFHIASLDFINSTINKYCCGGKDLIDLDNVGIDGDFGKKRENNSYFGTSIENDLKQANVDGVFIGHDHVNNYSILYNGIRYTYGTKTGTYDYYNADMLGGTSITLNGNGDFNVKHVYLDKTEAENRQGYSFTVTVLSDLHFDTTDYGGFYCTKSEEKLNRIVSETQGSRFYLNLGDTVNSCYGTLNNFYDAMSAISALDLNVYNSNGTGYIDGNRMFYNLPGNHEAAYNLKSDFADYIPYVDGVGSVLVFKYEDIMFIAVDAVFNETGYDRPEEILPCKSFSIPEKEISWLTSQVASQMDSSIKGIVWFSHVALQDIDVASKTKLMNELKAYGLPMTIFDGHTHQEAYHEYTDEVTGEVYCVEYTLPAVVLYDTYPYYNVTFRNGKVWYIEHTEGSL